MSYKILVAGAGHGGLTAAAILAKNGCDVTVVEKSPLKDLGYDWHDVFGLDAFDFADVPRPDPSQYGPYTGDSFAGPSFDEIVPLDNPGDPNTISMDRKILINHLVSHCRKCGVKFVFGTEIIAPVLSGSRVIGFTTRSKKGKKTFYGDLVIDAAGMNSPVRRQLPEKCGIQNEISENDRIYIWRGYFNRTDAPDGKYVWTVIPYHMCRPGLSWIIADPDFVDILIGKFSELHQVEVDDALEDFRSRDPRLGDTLIRGGGFVSIPIGASIPMLVCDGYAAVGDSASMVVPITGSGISLSMKAGKLLALAVMNDREGDFTRETLWSYQYRYYKILEAGQLSIYALRKHLTCLSAADVDFMFKNIITPEIITYATGDPGAGLSFMSMLDIAVKGAPQTPLMIEMGKAMVEALSAPDVVKDIPVYYEKTAVEKWLKEYKKLIDS